MQLILLKNAECKVKIDFDEVAPETLGIYSRMP